MTTEQLANVPVILKIEGLDSGGKPASLSIPLCASLPSAVGIALNRDLIALGKEHLTPYHRQQPQLKALSRMVRDEKDPVEREQLHADRQTILNRLSDGLLSGRADDLAAEAYWIEGRKSVPGLIREIMERAKHAGHSLPIAELSAVVTPGNAGLVLASLQEALGELADPTAAT
jgi:hypothetical protein